MKVLLILNGPAYGDEKGYNGLRLAHALSKADPALDLAVFLMADAVGCAKAGQIGGWPVWLVLRGHAVDFPFGLDRSTMHLLQRDDTAACAHSIEQFRTLQWRGRLMEHSANSSKSRPRTPLPAKA
jgi:hypothetical protein